MHPIFSINIINATLLCNAYTVEIVVYILLVSFDYYIMYLIGNRLDIKVYIYQHSE
jgi:hypothetical protein